MRYIVWITIFVYDSLKILFIGLTQNYELIAARTDRIELALYNTATIYEISKYQYPSFDAGFSRNETTM